MATKKRLIDANDNPCKSCNSVCRGHCDNYFAWLLTPVDAVPVDEILLHHILIDENGIPEVKLQFGDRTLVLRREDDPLDVREVVHSRWIYDHWCEFKCSVCGEYSNSKPYRGKENYCPNCGAKMDEV